MLQRIIVLFLLIIVLSCRSTSPQVDNETYIEGLFSGEIVDEWVKSLNLLRDNTDPEYIDKLFRVYLNSKYDPIRDNLGLLIAQYIEKYDYDMTNIVNIVNTVNEAELLIELAVKLRAKYIEKLVLIIYNMESSEIRTKLVELIGKELIDETYLDPLFNRDDKVVQLGIVSSCAYMTDEAYGDVVRVWLKDKLFLEDEEISSNALFSLSKHGSPGFLLLADNLLIISPRLQLVAIDILTFNKVSRAYPYYADLLNGRNPLLVKRVLNAYKGFSKKNDIYLIDALRNAHPDLTMEILTILKEKRDDDILPLIEFLIEREDMVQEVIDLAYERSSWDFLNKYVLSEDKMLKDLIIRYGVNISSEYLFLDRKIKNITLKYFLEEYDLSTVLGYLNSIDEDEKFINDYIILHSINRDLLEIESFELKNGVDPVVTHYFELEQKKILAKSLSDNFFNDMEMWLKNGDDTLLKTETLNQDLAGGNLKDERDEFLNSLEEDRKEEILLYESSKLSVLSSYRQITYRLKSFSENYIIDKGFRHLIK